MLCADRTQGDAVRFDHNIVSGSRAVGPFLAIASDAGIDDVRVDSGNTVVVHVVLLQGAREVVLHEDVAFFDELVENVYPRGSLE